MWNPLAHTVDFAGLRDILVFACPDVLPRAGQYADCRKTNTTFTDEMRAFVWNAAFRMGRKEFSSARSKDGWLVLASLSKSTASPPGSNACEAP